LIAIMCSLVSVFEVSDIQTRQPQQPRWGNVLAEATWGRVAVSRKMRYRICIGNGDAGVSSDMMDLPVPERRGYTPAVGACGECAGW
jgi:hypothetical protein